MRAYIVNNEAPGFVQMAFTHILSSQCAQPGARAKMYYLESGHLYARHPTPSAVDTGGN